MKGEDPASLHVEKTWGKRGKVAGGRGGKEKGGYMQMYICIYIYRYISYATIYLCYISHICYF